VDAGNYSFTDQASTTANITAKVVGLLASKTYDGTNSLTGWVQMTGLVGNEKLGYRDATSNGVQVATAGKYINQIVLTDGASGDLASNYALPVLNATNAPVTINKAQLSVTANDASKTQDGTAFTGGNGVRYAGFVNGEGANVLSGSLAWGGSSQGATVAGSYVITPKGLASGDYAFNYVDGQLVIEAPKLVVVPPVPTNPTASLPTQVPKISNDSGSGTASPITPASVTTDAGASSGSSGSTNSGSSVSAGSTTNTGNSGSTGISTSSGGTAGSTSNTASTGTASGSTSATGSATGGGSSSTGSTTATTGSGTATGSAGTSSGASTVSTGGSSSGSGNVVTLSVVRVATNSQTGLTMAFVPKKVIANQESFSIVLPKESLGSVSADTPVRLSTMNGQPLPSWLRYDAANNRIEISAVPPQGLPLQVQINVGGRVSVIYIADIDK